MKTSVFEPTVAGAIVADLVSLIPVLFAAGGVVLGAVVVITGWPWFRDRRYWRGMRIPSEDATGQDPGVVR